MVGTAYHSTLQALEIQAWNEAKTWDEVRDLLRFLGSSGYQFFMDCLPGVDRRDLDAASRVLWGITVLWRTVNPRQRDRLKRLAHVWLPIVERLVWKADEKTLREGRNK